MAHHHLKFILCCSLSLILFSNAYGDDPSARVARLSYFQGEVTLAPAGENDWVRAQLNRPLITADQLWADSDGKIELQLDTAGICIGPNSHIIIANLDNQTSQFQITQGDVILHIWEKKNNQTYEIDTPNLALTLEDSGLYRITVNPTDNITSIEVIQGQGTIYGENNSYIIDENQAFQFSGTDLSDYQNISMSNDEFAVWCSNRMQKIQAVIGQLDISTKIIGGSDLSEYGSWQTIEDYGDVWQPEQTSANWAPYQNGNWIWLDPWGWTWVDNEPWGFAPYHYGRWVYINEAWCWVPGPINIDPVYAPALVVFLQGFSLAANESAIGWLPLGPGDIYWPAYKHSRDYFNKINISNTNIDLAYLNRVYKNPNLPISYRNRTAPNAVTIISTQSFVQSQPVPQSLLKTPRTIINAGQITYFPKIMPTQNSILGSSTLSKIKPKATTSKPLLTKNPPPPVPLPYLVKQPELAKQLGKPLDTNQFSKTLSIPAKVKTTTKLVSPTRIDSLPAQPVISTPPQPAVAPSTETPTNLTPTVKQPPVMNRPTNFQTAPKNKQPTTQPLMGMPPLTTPTESPIVPMPTSNQKQPSMMPKSYQSPPTPAAMPVKQMPVFFIKEPKSPSIAGVPKAKPPAPNPNIEALPSEDKKGK